MEQHLYVVTGGGSGIGEATVRDLRSAGHQVIAMSRRSAPLEALAQETGCLFVAGDVAVPADVERLRAEVNATSLPLKGLVHAAGIMATGTVGETSLASWSTVLGVNLTGAFDVTRQLLPALRAAGGSVVMVGSVAADRTPGGAAAYAVSKAALVALARCVAVEEGRGVHPVRCNVVNPGWTRSAMADAEMAEAMEVLGVEDVEAAYAAVSTLVPMGRPALASEVSSVITWLLSDAASYVNGATVSVDGGHRLIDVGTVPFDFDVQPRP